MDRPESARPPLLPIAALVSLLVFLLGAAGLFALGYHNTQSAIALERLNQLHAAHVTAVKVQVNFKTQVQEWKNVLLRGSSAADYATYFGRFEQREADVQAGLAMLRTDLIRLGLDGTTATQLAAEHAALGAAYRQALTGYRAVEPASGFAVDASIRGIDRKLNDAIDALAQTAEAAAATELTDFRTQAAARYATLRQVILVLGGLTVLAAFWLVFQAARSRAAPKRPI
jgi:hypothetical protein